MRKTISREDIPEVKEILHLYITDKIHLLALPVLAGLDNISRRSPDYVLQLDNEIIRRALAFHFTHGLDNEYEWYKRFLGSRPDIVAEIYTAYFAAALSSDKPHVSGTYALAYIDEYGPTAKLASLSILKSFPVRCTNKQVVWMDELLKAALRHADRHALLDLTESKLGLASMNIAQRVRWLATGLIAAPEKYLHPLVEYTKSNEKRIQHLAGFLSYRQDQWSPIHDLPAAAQAQLVLLIGQYFSPYKLASGTVTPAMDAADCVGRLINNLGSKLDRDTTTLLDKLVLEPVLSRWQFVLQRTQFEQRAAEREAGFRHPDIQHVIETLNNKSPANAGDLAALTTELIQELAYRIRHGNTDDYRQFWNEATREESTSPKHEDTCRDALLSDLQQRLASLGIDAQPEGHYADDKRADIRVAFGGTDGFAIPVEIKKNNPCLSGCHRYSLDVVGLDLAA